MCDGWHHSVMNVTSGASFSGMNRTSVNEVYVSQKIGRELHRCFQIMKTLIVIVPDHQTNICSEQIFLLWYSTLTIYLKGYIIDKGRRST